VGRCDQPASEELTRESVANETVTLFRPVGEAELALIEQLEFRGFPPRLPEQPIFYPVLTESYAIQIARDWNARERSGTGFVTRFEVDAAFLARYEVQQVGARDHLEYWIPAEDLDDFNSHIVGSIEVIHSFANAGDQATGSGR
jgi:hypothetical protein